MNPDFSIHHFPSPNSIESTSTSTLDQLPNELLQTILAYLPLHQLLHFRLVCSRWQNMIESMQQPIRDLILTDSEVCEEQIKSRFFGQINLNDFVCLKIKPNVRDKKLSECFGALLRRLFPLIEQLLININFDPDLCFVLSLWPVDQITTLSIGGTMLNNSEYDYDDTDLADRINSLTSLRRLDLVECFHGFIESLVQTTLYRLEHFSCHYSEHSDYYEGDPVTKLIEQLGENCSRLWIDNFDLNLDGILQWHSNNLQWLSRVTHLKLGIEDDLEVIIPYLAEHATSLQVLHINSTSNVITLTPQDLGHLGRLTHLTELNLSNVFIADFNEWEKLDVDKQKLVQLASVITVILQLDMDDENENVIKGALAVLCPNVQQLSVLCKS